MRDHRQTSSACPPGRAAFTLTEVLVVMLILALLMSILMPIVGVVIQKMQAARSLVRVNTIARGAESFYSENNSRYPGQVDAEKWEDTYTGSQVLAAHMFGYYDETNAEDPYHNIQLENPQPATTRYMTFTGTMLMHRGDGNYEMNFLSDHFSTPMPIAYYPSGGGVGRAQFRFMLNSAFSGSSEITFRSYITDDNYGTTTDVPFNNEEFLLIGAGSDRIYFNEDDVHNWTN